MRRFRFSSILVAALFVLTTTVCISQQRQEQKRSGAKAFANQPPRVGELAPDFILATTTGDAVVLSSLYRQKPVVLEFGSISCPVFRGKIEQMERLYNESGTTANFLVVYTLEAHPADVVSPYSNRVWVHDKNVDEGILVDQPTIYDERWALALQAEALLGITRLLVVDNMDNAVWEQYGKRPNSAFIIATDGKVVTKQFWCNPQQLLRQLRGEAPGGGRPGDDQLANMTVQRDIEYGVVGGYSLKLDAYLPEGDGPFPAVINIHGGGWRGGDKGGFRRKAASYAQSGVASFSINYRLSGVATYPAAVDDCRRAVRWIRAHAAEFNIDTDRMGVEGGSAGGHLSLMMALMEPDELDSAGPPISNWFRCVYAKNGPTDFTQAEMGSEPALKTFMGGQYADMPEAYREASPLTYVSADAPPVLMIHGTEDHTVPYAQSVLLKQALDEVGIHAELITLEGAGHGLKGGDPEQVRTAYDRAHQFMLERLLAD